MAFWCKIRFLGVIASFDKKRSNPTSGASACESRRTYSNRTLTEWNLEWLFRVRRYVNVFSLSAACGSNKCDEFWERLKSLERNADPCSPYTESVLQTRRWRISCSVTRDPQWWKVRELMLWELFWIASGAICAFRGEVQANISAANVPDAVVFVLIIVCSFMLSINPTCYLWSWTACAQVCTSSAVMQFEMRMRMMETKDCNLMDECKYGSIVDDLFIDVLSLTTDSIIRFELRIHLSNTFGCSNKSPNERTPRHKVEWILDDKSANSATRIIYIIDIDVWMPAIAHTLASMHASLSPNMRIVQCYWKHLSWYASNKKRLVLKRLATSHLVSAAFKRWKVWKITLRAWSQFRLKTTTCDKFERTNNKGVCASRWTRMTTKREKATRPAIFSRRRPNYFWIRLWRCGDSRTSASVFAVHFIRTIILTKNDLQRWFVRFDLYSNEKMSRFHGNLVRRSCNSLKFTFNSINWRRNRIRSASISGWHICRLCVSVSLANKLLLRVDRIDSKRKYSINRMTASTNYPILLFLLLLQHGVWLRSEAKFAYAATAEHCNFIL